MKQVIFEGRFIAAFVLARMLSRLAGARRHRREMAPECQDDFTLAMRRWSALEGVEK